MLVKPNSDGGKDTNIKGRLNFGTVGSGPSHIITLSDSNFAKTVATFGNRPLNDPGDSYIGYDPSPNGSGITFGAAGSLSSYIGNNGDGVNWKERLDSTGKYFKTDVYITGNLVVSGKISQGGRGLQKKVAVSDVQSSFPAVTASTQVAVEGEREATTVTTKQAGQITYTLTPAPSVLNEILTEPDSPWVFVNRSNRLRIVNVYCEVDSGHAQINFKKGSTLLLATNLACTPTGATSEDLVTETARVDIGERFEHLNYLKSPEVRRITVVIKYFAE